jgi:peptidoglycan/LPS O-acetylase OafA/YrhL
MAASRYRPDIDGLRAVAVLSVVFFHAGMDEFSGGFVGVDVFFVISGFLITRLIRDGIDEGTFTFSNFYLRRARRLFPALFFTLCTSLVAGIIILFPEHLERFGGGLLHSILSVSNFYFWSEAGYFDANAELKPLLHTWSLSVEEQFYFVWPSLLFLLLASGRKYAAQLFILSAGLLSFYFCADWLNKDAAGAFFLAPFRVFEFAIGAIIVWLIDRQPKSSLWLEPLFVAGMAMVLYPVFSYSEDTVFPGFTALMPCIGTGLLLYAGTAQYAGRLLNNRAAVAVGLISYSLYLAHWPIIVFFKYYFARSDLGPKSTTAVIIASFVCATFMYFFVEKPFRQGHASGKRYSAPAFGLTCALCALILTLPAAHIWANDGWTWRFPVEVVEVVGNPREKKRASWAEVISQKDSIAVQDFGDLSVRRVLIVGDSHSKDVFNALYFNRDAIPSLELRRLPLSDNCLYSFANEGPPLSYSGEEIAICEADVSRLLESSQLKEADVVVLSSRWDDALTDWVSAFVDKLRSISDSDIVLMGRTAEFSSIPSLIMRNGLSDDTERLVASTRHVSLDELNEELRKLAQDLGIAFFDKLPFLCSENGARCDVLDSQGDLLYYDYGHWTIEGAQHFGKKIVASDQFATMIERAN